MVMREAQQAGLRCLAANVWAHSEAIQPDVNGLLFSLDSVDECAEAVCHLLTNEDMRSSMAKAAMKTSREMFSLERQADHYCDLYQMLAASLKN